MSYILLLLLLGQFIYFNRKIKKIENRPTEKIIEKISDPTTNRSFFSILYGTK